MLSRRVWVSFCVVMATGCPAGSGEQVPPLRAHFPYGFQATAECGAAQKSFPLEIDNPTSEDFEIRDAYASNGFSLIDPVPIVLPGGERGALTIRPPHPVIGTDLPPGSKSGELLLDTSDGTQSILLFARVIGANLAFTDAAERPLTLAFSGAQCPAPITARIRNLGNLSVEVTAPTPSAFRISGFVSATLASGDSVTFTVQPYTTSACTGMEALSFTATGPLCTLPLTIPASFSLTGSPTCTCN